MIDQGCVALTNKSALTDWLHHCRCQPPSLMLCEELGWVLLGYCFTVLSSIIGILFLAGSFHLALLTISFPRFDIGKHHLLKQQLKSIALAIKEACSLWTLRVSA